MSKKQTLFFVFGTRPESIKLAPLILEAQRKSFHVITCFTGQHKDMALPILEYFKIKVDYNLELMRPGQSLNDISLGLFEKLSPILQRHSVDFLVVQGDTTSAAVASIIGFQSRIPIAHIEAGLRTYNLFSPWPEEFNRRLISLAAQIHFAPTQEAVNNLKKEGLPEDKIFEVGNTGIDALRLVTESWGPIQAKYKADAESFVLLTLHRRENFGPEMQSLMSGLKEVCEQNPKMKVLWPLHQNPNVKSAFDAVFNKTPKNLMVVAPMNYFDFIKAMNESDFIVTDSGGIQEEAPFLGKPILICRNNTERPEAVACGSAKLIGTSKENLILEMNKMLAKSPEYQHMAQKRTPYGDGFSSEKVLTILQRMN